MTAQDFSSGQKVVYIPTNEHGVVKRSSEEYVFVQFYGCNNELEHTAKACRPADLR